MKKTSKNFSISSQKVEEITKDLLSKLKQRPSEIISRRFGLLDKGPMVLGKIGEEFNITRERVRQIECDCFKKLQEVPKTEEFEAIIVRAVQIVNQCGGFCEKRTLKKKLKADISEKEMNQMMLILNSSKELSFKKGKLNLRGFWFLRNNKIDGEVVKSHIFILRHLKEYKVPQSFEEVMNFLKGTEWEEFFAGEKGKKRLEMVLRMSRIISKNILGEWGLKNWKIISQRGAREKAYLILRKYDKPLHFRKITEFINKHWDEKRALPQTVHNELIKDERFVLIGRGIYGLHNWGYPQGTVREIISSFLIEQDQPVEKELIVEYVLDKKQVKKTTVIVTLADRVLFQKDELGRFTVKK
jgi:predicted Zn-ribbon and HTH transcriptional regulator